MSAVDHSELFGAEVVDQVLLIQVDQIDEGKRLRAVDPVWAEALGHMMQRDGQKKNIEVCRLPGATRWTLVDGAHRLAGARRMGIVYLRAEVVSANKQERRLREVLAQLAHRGLTDPIDRAAFIAELVQVKRAQAGIEETSKRDAKVQPALKRAVANMETISMSVHTHLKKAVAAEAGETLEMISNVYGWSDEVGEELGFTGRTIRNDLFLYRSLAPSLIERLRSARHPIAGNASQLRALAKLAPDDQRHAVDALLGEGGWEPCKNVAEAIRRVIPGRATTVTEDNKLLSRFTDTFRRMSVTQRKGALAQLAGMLPAGFSIVEGEQKAAKATFPADHARYRDEALERIDHVRELIDGLEEDEAIPGDRGYALYDAGRALQLVQMTIAGNGFELGTPAPSPSPAASDPPADAAGDAVAFIAEQLGKDMDARSVIDQLVEKYGARHRFANGTNELKLGKVMATSTAGGENLLRAWVRKAHAQKLGLPWGNKA